MPIKIRPHPAIPDHEVLRKIGGGAYGEVWLARGVTGALRAVKVVWREDFEDARGFEREFEGILKFEPMSRDHPALVNILHVGRSPDGISFYYYVMELGDDVSSGQDINPIEYEPKTLRADSLQVSAVQWNTSECIDVGLRLAEALDHLHERGLAHRDVKPSNVIFVNGRAKLADIGLVATRGQRTFVGTEGFVPPEGPGSSQADVYSLGKVLYEIATGKDRFSFPDLPDNIPTGADRKPWLELNKIICDICEPRISKRKISSAAELADALRRLQRGKRRRHTGMAAWLTTLVLVGFMAWAGWELGKDSDWVASLHTQVPTTPIQKGLMQVTSAPQGAEVYDAQGNYLGTTNTGFFPVTVGEDYYFTVKLAGFRTEVIKGKVPESVVSEPLPIRTTLVNFTPPKSGEKWQDQLGNSYIPVGSEHEGENYISKPNWVQFVKETKSAEDASEFLEITENGEKRLVVFSSEAQIESFRKWFRSLAIKGGYLVEDHEVVTNVDLAYSSANMSERAQREGLRPFRLLIRQINYGSVILTTEPPGVEVYKLLADSTNRISMGLTDRALPIPHLKPGKWQFYLVKEGYKPFSLDVQVGEGEQVIRNVVLEKSLGVVFGKPWENGIGMKMVPQGNDLLVCIWETRRSDYERFVKESGLPEPTQNHPTQPADHPVTQISRFDAQAFCQWLSKREVKEERIAQTHRYRLPTDLEWSTMAGLEEDPGISPIWRDARKQRVYPWGGVWLRPDQVLGNFADISASSTPGMAVELTIPGYDDKCPFTSPVGSFPPGGNGLFDLTGNVQEWVDDDYSRLGKDVLGVLRGGGWTTYQPESLLTGTRNAVPPNFKDASFGFRVVLVKESQPQH